MVQANPLRLINVLSLFMKVLIFIFQLILNLLIKLIKEYYLQVNPFYDDHQLIFSFNLYLCLIFRLHPEKHEILLYCGEFNSDFEIN